MMISPGCGWWRGVPMFAVLAVLLLSGPAAVAGKPEGRWPPDGTPLVAVDGGDFAYCGIRPDGRLVCWARDPGDLDVNIPRSLVRPPDGTFRAVSVGGDSTACAIRTNGRVACWGDNPDGMRNPPSGRFAAIGAGWSSACGIRVDRTVTCWGVPSVKPPAGAFTTLAVGQDVYCAVRVDGTAACWGVPGVAALAGGYQVPSGAFTGVGITFLFRPCGIRPDATLECWGDNMPGLPPDGRYSQADNDFGLLVDGTVVAWPQDLETRPPGGRFRAISESCGIRTDETLDCWDTVMPGTDAEPVPGESPPPPGLPPTVAGLAGAIAILWRLRRPAGRLVSRPPSPGTRAPAR